MNRTQKLTLYALMSLEYYIGNPTNFNARHEKTTKTILPMLKILTSYGFHELFLMQNVTENTIYACMYIVCIINGNSQMYSQNCFSDHLY
jgi:hypothetical protein